MRAKHLRQLLLVQLDITHLFSSTCSLVKYGTSAIQYSVCPCHRWSTWPVLNHTYRGMQAPDLRVAMQDSSLSASAAIQPSTSRERPREHRMHKSNINGSSMSTANIILRPLPQSVWLALHSVGSPNGWMIKRLFPHWSKVCSLYICKQGILIIVSLLLP